jgi:hypothetical protein
VWATQTDNHSHRARRSVRLRPLRVTEDATPVREALVLRRPRTRRSPRAG